MPDSELCGRTLGEFVLRERVDDDGGSSGDLYRAEQLLLKRDVLVRVLHQRPDDEALQRFLHDAQLEHPYAAHVYVHGVDGETGRFWVATELVRSVTLKQWLAAHGPMPVDQFVPFFECIVQVIQAAHDRGIVHRGLSPSNVMVLESAGRLCPTLLGLGLHQLTDGDAGSSPAYMAPEQWSDDDIGPAADIYALGAIAYEVLTGRAPFLADTVEAYREQHREAQVPPLVVDFANLDPILQRALAKRPEERHGTAQDLASALCTAIRTSPREQLRAAAQQWEDQSRAPGLLLGPDVLAKALQWTRTPSSKPNELVCSFIAASQRRARRFRWFRRSLVVTAAVLAVGAVLYNARMQTRAARQRAEATETQAELEQGRAALLHGEPEAQAHLAEAYKRDPAPSTAFMLARALQPRLAEQLRFASTKGKMWSATFSPDGRQLVTTDDQCAQVRDAQTGQLRFTLSHGDTVYQAVYSPGGARLITAGGDGTVKIWEATTGRLMRELTHAGKKFRYGIVAGSPDGKLVAAIDVRGEVAHAWDAATGALLAELHNDASEFPGLAFSADGRWLATSGGNAVHVFDARTWAQAGVLAGPGVHGLSWDPTGSRLLTGTFGGDVSIWAIPRGERIRHLREVGEPVDAVAFSPDGALLVVANRDGAEEVWSASSGTMQSQGNYLHSKIRFIEFDPTSKLIVAASSSGAVVVADAAQGMPVTVLQGPRSVVWVAHFDPDSRHVVGASWDGTARVWDATSPYRRWTSLPVSGDCGLVTGLEPDGRFIAIGCRDHNTRVWDTARDQLLAELPSVTQIDGEFAPTFPAVSASGDRAAIAHGSAVEVYELPGGRLLRTIVHPAAVHAIAFAREGNDLVSGAIDGSLRLTREGQDSLPLPGSPKGIDTIAWLPDGRIVATDAGKRLRVYDRGGAVLAKLDVPARMLSLRPAPDGRRLIALPSYADEPAMPLLLDLEHYRVITSLAGHVGRVFSARFEAGQIFTAGADGTARRWDGTSGQLLQTYQGGSRFLADATLAPDGSMVVAGGGDGLLRFWDTASARPLWTLQAHKSHLAGLHFEGAAIVTRGYSGDVSRWVLPRSEDVIQREAALSLRNEENHPKEAPRQR